MDHHTALIAGPMNGVTSIVMTSVSRTGSELGSVTENVAPDHLQLGSMVSRSEHSMSMAGVAHLASEDPTETDNMSYDRDFYQYVWFRLLISLILLTIFQVAIYVFFWGNVWSVVIVLGVHVYILIGLIPLYSLLFVFLDGYRVPISEFLQKLRIRRSVQHKLSHYLPYFILSSLVATSIILLIVIFR